ncbi:MAG: hypothetical protein CSA36_00560 [Draconibacterium sp.]|nr:MAG: hypothetical protein CSA36_00560 [Draconibacterium sp.]
MNKKVYLYILLFAILVISCEKEVILDFKHQPKICLNGLLSPDSIISVRLTLSHGLDSFDTFVPVMGAVVKIYEEEMLMGVLSSKGKGYYSLNKKPVEGRSYTITAKADNLPAVTATTTLPLKPIVEFQKETTGYLGNDSTMVEFDLEVQIKDKPGENYYWISKNWIIQNRSYGGPIQEVNTPYLDSFNKITDTEARYGYTLFLGVRLTDEGFDGQSLNFNIPGFFENIPYRYTKSVQIINADKHYDKYMKSSIINRMKETSDLPFYEPIQIYSNIENGYGIFGSYASTIIFLQ